MTHLATPTEATPFPADFVAQILADVSLDLPTAPPTVDLGILDLSDITDDLLTPAAPAPRTHTVPATLLAVALAARRINPAHRWAAMAEHTTRNTECQPRPAYPWLNRAAPQPVTAPAHITPMQRGGLHRLIDRVRLAHGPATVRATWAGTNYLDLRAEPALFVPAQ